MEIIASYLELLIQYDLLAVSTGTSSSPRPGTWESTDSSFLCSPKSDQLLSLTKSPIEMSAGTRP